MAEYAKTNGQPHKTMNAYPIGSKKRMLKIELLFFLKGKLGAATTSLSLQLHRQQIEKRQKMREKEQHSWFK